MTPEEGNTDEPLAVEYCPRDGKVRHPSRKVALQNLNRVRRNHDRAARDRRVCGKLNVYRCQWCAGGWHLGNDSPDETRARLRRQRRPELRDDDTEAA